MKKLTFIFLTILLPVLLAGQTIVDTDPQNKSVVIELYTGVNCGYCPQGAELANQIYNANPDRVTVVSIHAGGFANPLSGQPDFRTPFGPGLLGQTGITAFPAATVNRHLFYGSKTGMLRNYWEATSNIILDEPSYLNVAANAEIDLQTRELTVLVEVFYTGNSPLANNKLNVALLQDKTYGYQASGGNNYEHNNRLVHLLTGQWGEEITETTEGTFITRTYQYTIPEDYNQIPAELLNMRVAAFVAETSQEIISGVQVTPTPLNMPEFEYSITGHSMNSFLWDGIVQPKFTLKSFCTELSSVEIEYFVNNEEVHTYTWEGSLFYGQEEEVELPEINFNILPQNNLQINIINEDASPENNSLTINFAKAVTSVYQDLIVEILVDQYGSETTWNIVDEQGEIVESGGPYPNQVATHTHQIYIPYGNYTVNYFDFYGDGSPGGHLHLKDEDATLINIPGNSFNFSASAIFGVVELPLVTFTPENNAFINEDAVLSIVVSKKMLTEDYMPASESNYQELISLKYDDAFGAAIPFSATVTDQKEFAITPDVLLLDGSTVYLAIKGMDSDFLEVDQFVTFTTEVGVNVGNINMIEYAFSPNPASDIITFTLPSQITTAQVKIFSLNGQLVVSDNVNTGEMLNVQHLPEGIYLVKVSEGKFKSEHKIIISR